MRYLVATDGSEEATGAVQYAARQAIAFDATLEIVHVLTPETKLVNGELVLAGGDKAMEIGGRTLQQARQLAGEAADEYDTDLAVETELLTGRPADVIVDYATETDVDAIYVGHQGRSEERERIVGSVAKRVIDRAPVPVTVIR